MARSSTSGQGRPKGAANKLTKALKDMILGALDDAGGQGYLLAQAKEEPKAFLALLGRVLPQEIKGTLEASVIVIERSYGEVERAPPES